VPQKRHKTPFAPLAPLTETETTAPPVKSLNAPIFLTFVYVTIISLKWGEWGEWYILWLSFRPLSPPHPSGAGWGEWGDGGAGWEQQRNRDGTNRKASTPTILLSNNNVLLTMTDSTRICHISHWPELTFRDHSVSHSDARAWTGYCPL
jgi:hypothetical protein